MVAVFVVVVGLLPLVVVKQTQHACALSVPSNVSIQVPFRVLVGPPVRVLLHVEKREKVQVIIFLEISKKKTLFSIQKGKNRQCSMD